MGDPTGITQAASVELSARAMLRGFVLSCWS